MNNVYSCPKCQSHGYMPDGSRCSMCGGKRYVEDGGPSVAVGETGLIESPYIGASGYRIVLNYATPAARKEQT